MPVLDPQRELVVLDEPAWRLRAAAHEARVDALVGEHLSRRRAGRKHPVHDFLFTYYSFRPAQLRRWSPGYGVVLAGGPDPIPVDDVLARRDLIAGTHALLAATAGRPANLGCFGMHEWAMVYRLAEDETRHATYPLRLGPAVSGRSAGAVPGPAIASGRTAVRCRASSVPHRWGGHGCTGRNGASPPSRAARRSSRRA